MSQQKFVFLAEEDEKLIDAIAAHHCVYDLKHMLYKDQRAKDNVWVVIAEEVGRTVNDCKKRWKNIKDTYERRNREIQKTGSEAPPYKKARTWALQERLSFLRTCDNKRESFCNRNADIGSNSEHIEDLDYSLFNLQNETVPVSAPQQETTSASVSLQKTPPASEPQLETFPATVPQISRNEPQHSKCTGKPKRMTNRDKIFLAIEKRSKERDVMIKELLKKDEETDDVCLFFQSIAKTVRKFPAHLQQRAKLETLTLISRIESDMWSSTSISSPSTAGLSFISSPSPCSDGSGTSTSQQDYVVDQFQTDISTIFSHKHSKCFNYHSCI